tara:strand:- start:125 stop:313 length:189 start_codon:yes stop_codon:yes gene_type:complete
MKAGDLVRYTEDIHDDIGIVIKMYGTRNSTVNVAVIQWVDDLSVDYFADYNWNLLEVISENK